MIAKKLLRPRTLIAVLAVLLVMIAAYAYAAANNVDPSGAGDGSGPISGYDVTNIHYTLDGADPSYISAVSFDLTPSGIADPVTEVKVQLYDGGLWFDCDEGATPVSCTITGVTVLAATQFRVVAVQ